MIVNDEKHRGVLPLLAITGAVAAGYLWAVVFGDGVHGLKSVRELDDADSFPDANVALLVAMAFYLGSPVAASWFGATRALRWFAATAIAGACLFVLSRLFV